MGVTSAIPPDAVTATSVPGKSQSGLFRFSMFVAIPATWVKRDHDQVIRLARKALLLSSSRPPSQMHLSGFEMRTNLD